MTQGLPPELPGILLVEDDAVSQAFLAAALESLPARVDAVAGAAAALRAVAGRGDGYALWLVDAHLPDADGICLLARLRRLAPWTPAFAHTASRERKEIDALLAAGYGRVLRKPIAAADLRAAVAGALHPRAAVAEARAPADPRWNVAALRQLFREELPAQQAALAAAVAGADLDAAAGVLHRLRASCALVEAHALDAAVRTLQRAPGSAAALEAFNRTVAAWLRRA